MLSFSNKNNMRHRILASRPHGKKRTSVLLSLLIAMFVISLPILSAQAAAESFNHAQSYLSNLTTTTNVKSDTEIPSDYIEYTEAEEPFYWSTLPEQDTLEPLLFPFTLSPGQRYNSGNINCTASTEVTLYGWVSPKGKAYVGISDGAVRTYIVVTGFTFEYTFHPTHTAVYRAYIENGGDEAIEYDLNISVTN